MHHTTTNTSERPNTSISITDKPFTIKHPATDVFCNKLNKRQTEKPY